MKLRTFSYQGDGDYKSFFQGKAGSSIPSYGDIGSPPVWHTSDQKNAFSSNNDIIVDKPDNVSEGDLIVVIFSDLGDTEVTSVPTGFNLITSEGGGGANNPKIYSYYKVATGSEPSTYTFTQDDTGVAFWLSGRVTGFNSGNVIDKTSGDNSGGTSVTSLSIPSITPADSNSLLIAARGVSASTTSPNVPSGMVGVHSSVSNILHVAQEDLSNTDPTGNKEFTWTNSVRATGIMFNINPSG